MSRFTQFMDRPASRSYIIGCIFFALVFLILVNQITRTVFFLGVNLTDSVPRGLYSSIVWRPFATKLNRGDYVSFCPPSLAYQQIARMPVGDRIHIPRLGSCPMNAVPFIKTVAAIAGDTVVITSGRYGWISVNGIRRPFSAQTATDKFGQPRDHMESGSYIVPQNKFLALGTNPRNDSWDSRYWGFVDVSSVISKEYPIFVEHYK